LRGVRTISNARNLGFAAAVNQGVRATTAPLILLLNPDARLEHGVEALTAAFDSKDTGAAGGLLIGPDGRPQSGFMARRLPTPAALIFEVLGINRLWPRNRVNWNYRCFDLDPVTPCLVDQPAGAFLMFSRYAWERVGGFDERFHPIWFEDVDFCARLLSSGLNVRYIPAAVARHEGAHAARALPLEIRERYWYVSLLEYAAKHFEPLSFRFVAAAVVVGAGLRAARVLPRRGLKAVAVYGAICRLAFGRMLGSGRGERSSVV
jgi:GT2 family glycosyltransferase